MKDFLGKELIVAVQYVNNWRKGTCSVYPENVIKVSHA